MMTYLITGGTGFIGSYVARLLLRAGERVVAYDIAPDENTIGMVCSARELACIRIVAGDIQDLDLLCRAIEEHRVQKVIHLAALLGPAAQTQPALAVRVNCDGLNNVFEAARSLGLIKVVWMSTSGVFGPAERHDREFVPDDGTHYPLNVYAACKSLNEFMAHHYHDSYGVNSTGLRFGLVYGFGRLRGGTGFGTEMMHNAACGRPYTVPYADAVFDWLHVEDAARAIVLACHVEKTATRILNGVGEFASVRQVAALISGFLPQAALTLTPGLLFGTQLAKPDGRRIKHELGFEPRHSLRDGVLKTINEYRHGAGLQPMSSVPGY